MSKWGTWDKAAGDVYFGVARSYPGAARRAIGGEKLSASVIAPKRDWRKYIPGESKGHNRFWLDRTVSTVVVWAGVLAGTATIYCGWLWVLRVPLGP